MGPYKSNAPFPEQEESNDSGVARTSQTDSSDRYTRRYIILVNNA